MANDNFNAVFEKYDRFMQRRVEGGAAGGNEQGAPAVAAAPPADLMSFGEGKSLQDQLHALSKPFNSFFLSHIFHGLKIFEN